MTVLLDFLADGKLFRENRMTKFRPEVLSMDSSRGPYYVLKLSAKTGVSFLR
jgi:hypothetical protein